MNDDLTTHHGTGTHVCLQVTVQSNGAMDIRTHLPAGKAALVLRDAADQYSAETGTFRERPEAERLAAILGLLRRRHPSETVTVGEVLSAGVDGVEQP